MSSFAATVRFLRTFPSRTALGGLVVFCASACGAPAEDATLSNDAASRENAAPNDRPLEGGQTGGIGGESLTYANLQLDEVGPGGFSAAEAIEALSGEAHAELVYESGERTRVSFQLSANGAEVGWKDSFEGRYLFEVFGLNVERNRMLFGVDARFTTADGKFDETLATELSVYSLDAALLYFELVPSELQGSYIAPFDAEAAGEDASRARVRVNANLQRQDGQLQTSGELFGSFPTPEVLPGGAFTESRLAGW